MRQSHTEQLKFHYIVYLLIFIQVLPCHIIQSSNPQNETHFDHIATYSESFSRRFSVTAT